MPDRRSDLGRARRAGGLPGEAALFAAVDALCEDDRQIQADVTATGTCPCPEKGSPAQLAEIADDLRRLGLKIRCRNPRTGSVDRDWPQPAELRALAAADGVDGDVAERLRQQAARLEG